MFKRPFDEILSRCGAEIQLMCRFVYLHFNIWDCKIVVEKPIFSYTTLDHLLLFLFEFKMEPQLDLII